MKHLLLNRVIITVVALCLFQLNIHAQTNTLKGTGEVFYTETFDWGNPADERGWTMPDGFYMEDPTDNGFNWHWWPNDSLVAEYTFEPPFQSTTANDGHLCLFANLYNNYTPGPERIGIDNSIVFPPIDCSEHSSVILRFQTSFMNYGSIGNRIGEWLNIIEVSNNNGMHWASFNANFNCGSKRRPNDAAPGEPAIFEANISVIAAGMPNVLIRINWKNYFGLYFWIIDDFELAEANDNDIRIQYVDLEWDNLIEETHESVSFMMPISQLQNGHSFHQFESGIINMGEFVQNDVELSVTITKNNAIVFQDKNTLSWLESTWPDSLSIESSYEPKEFGHYAIEYNWQQAEEDDFPKDNSKTIFFHVTDSVYSRADDQAELSFIDPYYNEDDIGSQTNIDHFLGSKFPIYGDCELDGVSVYIMGGLADGLIDFHFAAFEEVRDEVGELIDVIQILSSEPMDLDSSMFHQWIYLPFDKDGESELVQAGNVIYAGIQFSNFHKDEMVRRNKGLAIGVDNSTITHDNRGVGYRPHVWTVNPSITEKNYMVRLYINDHTNRTDNIDEAAITFTLQQNFPNPFNNRTEISYTLDHASQVNIKITDITGKQVMILEEGVKAIGKHIVSVESSNLNPGVYFYTLSTELSQETKSMIVLD